MQTNVGNIDKIVRIALGAAILSLVFVGPETPFGWVGLVLIVTGFMNFCPLYSVLGFRTNKPKAG